VDVERFDRATRTFALSSRRHALKAVFAGTVAGVLALREVQTSAAASCRREEYLICCESKNCRDRLVRSSCQFESREAC
jgi:hypothetical protein